MGTDDTDLLLASLTGYDHRRDWHPDDALESMLEWYSARPLDVGNQTRSSLIDWSEGRTPEPDEFAQGNGGLMRAAAHGIAARSFQAARVNAADDTYLTHPSDVATICSSVMAGMVFRLIYEPNIPPVARQYHGYKPYRMGYESKLSGHCVHSLRLATTALTLATSYEDGIDKVVRTGGDTDTNAAIAGALLGAKFGFDNIPEDWVVGIDRKLAEKIAAVRTRLNMGGSELCVGSK